MRDIHLPAGMLQYFRAVRLSFEKFQLYSCRAVNVSCFYRCTIMAPHIPKARNEKIVGPMSS